MESCKTLLAKVRRFITALGARGQGEKVDLPAEIETLWNMIQKKDQEVEEKKLNIGGLTQSLKDLIVENSDLQRQVQDLKRKKSTVRRDHQNTLGRLKKAEAEGRNYCTELEKSSEHCDSLTSQYNEVGIEKEKIVGMMRNQEQEIKILRNTNIEIRGKLETQVEQLNKFTGEIARQNQRVNTSAIRDDGHFGRKFSGLAKEIRDWSFTHFFPHSEASAPSAVAEDLKGAICEIAGETNLHKIFKDRVTSRRVVAGLLANKLTKELFQPFLLGLLSEEFTKFESEIEKTGAHKSQWLSQTISLFVKTEQFKKGLDEKVRVLSQDLGEMLGRLVALEFGKSKASKRNQKLRTIVERAANLAVEASQQPCWFHFLTFPPGREFNPFCMEDVGTEVSLDEDDLGTCEDDCRVSLSVFPYVYRLEHVESEGYNDTVMISQGWVTVETGDGHTAVEQKDGDMENKETAGGVGLREECPGEYSQDGGELGAEGERSEISPHSNVLATKWRHLRERSPQGYRSVSKEANLEADVDLAREGIERVSIS